LYLIASFKEYKTPLAKLKEVAKTKMKQVKPCKVILSDSNKITTETISEIAPYIVKSVVIPNITQSSILNEKPHNRLLVEDYFSDIPDIDTNHYGDYLDK